MDKNIKKNIRLLAEKFSHVVAYEKEVILLYSQLNQIRVWQEDKYGVRISYNVSGDLKEVVDINVDHLYDVLIDLMRRSSDEDGLKVKSGPLLSIEKWCEEEGRGAKEQLEELNGDLQHKAIEYRRLGGNRYMAEYFKGILILEDDLIWAKANVITV